MEGTVRGAPPRTDATHPAGQYTTVGKWFHWVTVVLMAVALSVGPVIKYIKDENKMAFYAIHESAGLTILLVTLARIVWRLTHPAPPLPDSIPRPMQQAAATVHISLYLLLVVQPILGFFMTNAFGFPLRGQTAYLGFINLPKFMETNEPLAEVLKSAHTTIGYAILALLIVHVGAAVFHQAIRRDGTLLRML